MRTIAAANFFFLKPCKIGFHQHSIYNPLVVYYRCVRALSSVEAWGYKKLCFTINLENLMESSRRDGGFHCRRETTSKTNIFLCISSKRKIDFRTSYMNILRKMKTLRSTWKIVWNLQKNWDLDFSRKKEVEKIMWW